jgi:hypothetical protein
MFKRKNTIDDSPKETEKRSVVTRVDQETGKKGEYVEDRTLIRARKL